MEIIYNITTILGVLIALVMMIKFWEDHKVMVLVNLFFGVVCLSYEMSITHIIGGINFVLAVIGFIKLMVNSNNVHSR